MRHAAMRPGLCLAILTTLLVACDETDVASIKVVLDDSGGGSLQATTLHGPDAPCEVERQASGIEWKARACVVSASGRFAALDGVTVSDIRFEASDASGKNIRICLPMGADRRWPGALAPATSVERSSVRGAAPAGADAAKLGTSIKLEVQVPGVIVAHGFSPSAAAGVFEEVNDKKGIASLMVPVDLMTMDRDLVWHLSWE